MIASARTKGIEQDQKGKGERSTKPTKGDGGKKKSTKKATGQPCSQAQSGNGGGIRGQSQSCHQCRQSIHSSKGVSEVKSGRERLKCSRCTRYWCEQCLQNRYGVVKAEADPLTWICPVCNKNCNCSLCRKKAGKLATGILTPLVKSAGFGNVSDFLDKGTDDIAKVLQWKSPEIAEETASQARKKRRPVPDHEGESKAKRKKGIEDEDTENSTTLANIPSPVNGSHSDGGRRPKNGQYRRSNSRPKRRRLSHSSYSITIDEDSLDIELPPSAKLTDLSTLKPSPAVSDSNNKSPSTDDCGAATQGEERRSKSGKTGKMLKSPRLSKSESESEADTSIAAEVSSPFRRSQRKRKTTSRYSSHDFRPVADEKELIASPPKSKKRRKEEREEKRVSFKSPPYSPKSAESADSDSCSDGGQSVDFLMKQKELEELRSSTMNALRESKVISRQEIVKEKARLREETRKERLEKKRKILEEKAKLREAKKLNKLATQEKLKLARNLLREAQKDARRRQKEREKKRKQEELHLLKEKRQSEKRRRQELTSVPILRASDQIHVDDLKDDTPEQCEASGVPSLPDLPTLELPFSTDMIPQFLFVSEFLYTFANALGLKRRLNARELSKLMAGGRGLGDLYLYLLQVLVDEDSQLQKQLKPSKRQRDLEHLARTYLRDIGKNGFIVESGGCQSMEESLIILHHLCEEALDSSAVVDHMEACQEQCDQLRREERVREREKSREISEELKQLCEGGACSLEHIQERRKEFTLELEEMRRSSEQEQLSCRLAVRNTYLGKDRYDRIFWKLQSFPGIVVEVLSSHSEVEEGFSTKDKGPVISQWLAINSTEQLEQFMGALHPRGRREKQLLSSLTLHQADIAVQLKEADHQSKIKKFYGSN